MKRNTSKQTRLSLQVHERGTVYQQLYAQPPKSFSSFNKELQSFLFRLTFCGNVYTDCVKCSSNSSYRITELNKLSQLEYIMLHIHRGAKNNIREMLRAKNDTTLKKNTSENIDKNGLRETTQKLLVTRLTTPQTNCPLVAMDTKNMEQQCGPMAKQVCNGPSTLHKIYVARGGM